MRRTKLINRVLRAQEVGQGIYELYRQQAAAAEQRRKPQPTKPVYAPGSVEWLNEQKKSG